MDAAHHRLCQGSSRFFEKADRFGPGCHLVDRSQWIPAPASCRVLEAEQVSMTNIATYVI